MKKYFLFLFFFLFQSQILAQSINDFVKSFEESLNEPGFSITNIKENYFGDSNPYIEDDLVENPPILSSEANPITIEEYLNLYRVFNCGKISFDNIFPSEKKVLDENITLYIVQSERNFQCENFKTPITRYFLIEKNQNNFLIRTITFSYPSIRNKKWNDSPVQPESVDFPNSDDIPFASNEEESIPDSNFDESENNDCSSYLERIAILEQEKANCISEKNQYLAQVNSLKADTVVLNLTIRNQKIIIDSLRLYVQELQDSIKELNAIVACVKRITPERIEQRKYAETLLAKADSAFYYFERHFGDASVSDNEKRQKLEYAWNTYQSAGYGKVKFQCGDIEMEYIEDYMTGRQHLNSAKILANKNDGLNSNIINLMGENPRDRLNQMNEYILAELGRVYGQDKEKKDYDAISEANSMVLELVFNFFPERKKDVVFNGKGDENSEEKIGNSEAAQKINSIYENFKIGEYQKAITTYSKYQKIFEIEGVKENEEKILKAKFAAGSILLWDLNEISENHGLLLQGSWLLEKISNRYQIGRDLLDEFIVSTDDDELKRRAIITLRKHYKP